MSVCNVSLRNSQVAVGGDLAFYWGKDGKMKKSIIIFCILLAVTICVKTNEPAIATTELYMLGDADDGNYNGVGSVDDVYYDPDWYDLVDGVTPRDYK